jgi:endonuclease G
MSKIILLLLLIPNFVLSQLKLRDSITIKSPIYEILYSEKLESPLRVAYTVECPTGKASRDGMDFYTNDSIHTTNAQDYINNVYDKGHMAPAADFNCTRDLLYQTFSYLNCSLQNQYLNRGVWELLEKQERQWAKKETVKILIEVKFDKRCKKLSTGATPPAGFYKTINLCKSNVKYKYYFPNIKPTKARFEDYQIK